MPGQRGLRYIENNPDIDIQTRFIVLVWNMQKQPQHRLPGNEAGRCIAPSGTYKNIPELNSDGSCMIL